MHLLNYLEEKIGKTINLILYRDIVGSHPIFKLGKSITLNNEKNLETFWNFVFKDGATKLNDYSEEAKDDYRRILSKDLDNL